MRRTTQKIKHPFSALKDMDIEAILKIRFVFFDVDGVLTDGGIYFVGDKEVKKFNALDEGGIKYLLWNDIGVGFISGSESESVLNFAKKLEVSLVFCGIKDKISKLQEFLDSENLRWDEIAFMGDDLIDLPAMLRSGFSFAPANAHIEIKNRARYICALSGGSGAVREVADVILKAKGIYKKFIRKYLR